MSLKFIIVCLVFFYLGKLLFSGSLQFKGNFVRVAKKLKIPWLSSFKVAQNSFQQLDFDGSLYYNYSLSLDATIMVSKNCPIIGENVVVIFVTQ